jgi:uncharacterized protein
MTDQERQMIDAVAKRIQDAPAPQIDRDADDLIRRTIGARTDALYILTQTVLLQEMALTQAKAQIDELKQRVASAGDSSSSFLGSSPAERGPQAGGWAQESKVQQSGGYRGSSYQESGYQQPPIPPPQYAPPSPQPSGGGAFSGFLRNAATTAAGVVAGELAFSSLASILGHHPGGFFGGGGGFFGGGSPASPVSETIINNYYEDDRERGALDDRPEDAGRDEDRYASGSDSDLQDVSDDGSDDDSDDYSSSDDTGYDDSGSSDV